MTTRFSYSGTSPATVYSCVRDPDAAGLSISKKWMSPMIESAGGVRFVYDKNVVKSIMTLTWSHIDTADLAGILSFLAVVGYGSNAFDFTDPAGGEWTAQLWGPDRMSWVETDVDNRSFTIELLVAPNPNLIVNGYGWSGTDGATPPDYWAAYNAGAYAIDSGFLEIQRNVDANPGAWQRVAVIIGHSYILSGICVNDGSGSGSVLITAGNSGAGSTEYSWIVGGGSPVSQHIHLTATSEDLDITLLVTTDSGSTPIGTFNNISVVDESA